MITPTTIHKTARNAPPWVSSLLWLLAAAGVLSHLTSMLLHLPQAMAGAMLAGSLMLFGLFHGASTYGWRGIVFFIVLCLGVSNAFENLSILTGFPFGWYHYGDKMGPRLFLLPLLIGPLYFGVGYLSWTLARAILGDTNGRLAGRLVLQRQSSQVSSWFAGISRSTRRCRRSPATGSGEMVFLQVFALYARRLSATRDHIPGYWAKPLLAYISIVIAPILSLTLSSASGAVLDATGPLS